MRRTPAREHLSIVRKFMYAVRHFHPKGPTVTGILTPELHTTLNSNCANWMRLKGLSLSTVAQYIGILQAFFKRADPADPNAVEAYVSSRSLRTVSRLYTAYGQWKQFQSSLGNDEWPDIDRTQLPPSVLPPLSVLLNGRCRIAVRLRWLHAVRDDQGEFTGQILHPDDNGDRVMYLFFQPSDSMAEMLKTLETWGKPQSEESPLIPSEPGSAFPRNERLLGKERKQGEAMRAAQGEELMEAPQAATPQSTPERASEASEGSAPSLTAEMTAEERLGSLTELLGREPTPQEKEIYNC